MGWTFCELKHQNFGKLPFEASANLPFLRFLWETHYERSHLQCRTWILHRGNHWIPSQQDSWILHILQLVLLLLIFFSCRFRTSENKMTKPVTPALYIIYIYMLNLPTVHMIPRVTQDSPSAQAQPLENLQEVEVGGMGHPQRYRVFWMDAWMDGYGCFQK